MISREIDDLRSSELEQREEPDVRYRRRDRQH